MQIHNQNLITLISSEQAGSQHNSDLSHKHKNPNTRRQVTTHCLNGWKQSPQPSLQSTKTSPPSCQSLRGPHYHHKMSHLPCTHPEQEDRPSHQAMKTIITNMDTNPQCTEHHRTRNPCGPPHHSLLVQANPRATQPVELACHHSRPESNHLVQLGDDETLETTPASMCTNKSRDKLASKGPAMTPQHRQAQI